MPTLDVFRGNAFSVQEMTEAINMYLKQMVNLHLNMLIQKEILEQIRLELIG